MKSPIVRIAGVTAITLLILVVASIGPAMPALAQGEEISDYEKRMNYSLYFESFRNEDYQAALPYLKWVIEHAPDLPRSDDTNFERLIDAYAGLARQTDDPDTRKAYLDTALVWFDESVRMMEELALEFSEVQWQLRKGRFVQEQGQALGEDAPSLAPIYLEAFEMGGCEIDPYYVRIVIDDYVRSARKQMAVDMNDRAAECYAENAEMMSYITQVRNNLFTSPEERMTFLESRLEQTPEDVEIASELFDIYLELQYREEAAELGERLLELAESAVTYRRLGELHLQDGNTEQAIEFYERALEMPIATDGVRRDILFNLGIAKQQDGALSEARSFFRRALEIDPNYGRAYIAIGDLYATAVSQCGTFEREDQAVYWLAFDYFLRAKAIDQNVAAQADQKISAYRQSLPNQEALFFKGWEPGDTYRIDYGCYTWINESTTVKQPG